MKKFLKHFIFSYIGIALLFITYTIVGIIITFYHEWWFIQPNTFLFAGVIPFFSLFISLYRHDFNPKTKKIIILVFIAITLIYFIPKNMHVPNYIEKQGGFGIYDNEKQEFIYPTEYKEDICFGLYFSRTSASDSWPRKCFGLIKTTVIPIDNSTRR